MAKQLMFLIQATLTGNCKYNSLFQCLQKQGK